MHDVVPFRAENTWLLWALLAIIHWLVDGYTFLSDSSKGELFQRFPSQRGKPRTRIDPAAFDVDVADEPTRRMHRTVLPYTRGWNSGMAMLVLSAHSRVLATNRPLFLEFDKSIGVPWLYTFDNDPSVRSASLSAALNVIRTDTVSLDDEARLDRYLAERSFERVGQALHEFYRRFLAR